MEKKLPNNWVEISLIDISNFIDYRGKTPKKTDSGIPLITAKNVKKGFINREPREYIDENAYDDWMTRGIPRVGDILITTEAPLGNVAMIDISEKFALAQRVITIQVQESLSSPFIKYYLQSPKGQNDLVSNSTGTTVSGIKSSRLKQLEMPIPPLPEQKRIVTKLDGLFAHLEEVKTRLEKVPQLLKDFRQSVLTQAVTGKLTEEWREGKELGAWEKTKIGELFTVKTGATPKRGTNEYYNDATIPWLKSGQVKNKLIYHAEEYITELAVKETNANIYPKETLLVAMYGEGKTRGQVGWMKIEAASNQAIAALVNLDMLIQTRQYVFYYCLSQYAEIRKQAEGGNQPNLNLSKIKNWKINLPPFEEQPEIVSRVEALFAKADAIEEKYTALKQKVDNLPQAILAKAFRGELVEQLPTDGSAKELLEEIKKLKEETKKWK